MTKADSLGFRPTAFAVALVTLCSAPTALPAASVNQLSFSCKTNELIEAWSSGSGVEREGHRTIRRDIRGAIALTLDTNTGEWTLVIQTSGRREGTFHLTDLEQTSSPGSGVSFKADTTVRGTSGIAVFTLFAAYDNANVYRDPEAKGDAVLSVDYPDHRRLFVCGPHGYSTASNNFGPHGTADIFTLRDDGLAGELRDPPEWPDYY